jgi:hypothetical protein
VHKFGKLIGAVSLLALCTAPAAAAGFDGLLSGDYGYTGFGSGNGHANDWGFDGAGAYNLGWSNISIQGEGGWHDFSGNGSWNDWNAGGALYWTGNWARLGATAGYQSESGDLSGNVTNYGAFGNLYAGSNFTIGVKGGGFSGNDGTSGPGNGLSGGNAGAQAIVYFWQNFALSGTYDYYKINHGDSENDFGAKVEWLFSQRVPVSVWGAYQHSQADGLGHANSFLIGLKLYTDSFGPAPLVARQRSGVEQWGTSFSPTGFVY